MIVWLIDLIAITAVDLIEMKINLMRSKLVNHIVHFRGVSSEVLIHIPVFLISHKYILKTKIILYF